MFGKLFTKCIPEPTNCKEYADTLSIVRELEGKKPKEYVPPVMKPIPKHNKEKDLQEFDYAMQFIHKGRVVKVKFDNGYNRNFSDGKYFHDEAVVFTKEHLTNIFQIQHAVNFKVLFPKKFQKKT